MPRSSRLLGHLVYDEWHLLLHWGGLESSPVNDTGVRRESCCPSHGLVQEPAHEVACRSAFCPLQGTTGPREIRGGGALGARGGGGAGRRCCLEQKWRTLCQCSAHHWLLQEGGSGARFRPEPLGVVTSGPALTGTDSAWTGSRPFPFPSSWCTPTQDTGTLPRHQEKTDAWWDGEGTSDGSSTRCELCDPSREASEPQLFQGQIKLFQSIPHRCLVFSTSSELPD
ncbi:uncharacterized protein LOC101713563 [Heterocephalus glaber]|uniref:Uncharacterized protein LOC101713563 n=1 Tax=Heterocephalus glaber TaxID=10181 RepID=A0AAX6SXN3_HETGA|nr:uncharacterized protein LOC101713563 [Heterocephalus glaber]